MNLLSSSLQTYEKNQNLAGWVQQTESIEVTDNHALENDLKTDDVSISSQRDIYAWIAQSLPENDIQAENFGQVKQQLFDYGLINFSHQATINDLISENPDQPIAKSIHNALESSTSYSRTQNLTQVAKVFNNLAAAQQAYR